LSGAQVHESAGLAGPVTGLARRGQGGVVNETACQHAEQALNQLGRTWYATGMDRVLEVRKALQPWAGQE
jgi:hypothetical protein